MALKKLIWAPAKADLINQSSEIEAPTTLNNFEWQKGGLTTLSDAEREEYEERAAIMEYDGGLSRAEAERRALERLERKQPKQQTKQRMYFNTKTWNPAVGCGFACIYCKPSFQELLAAVMGKKCDGCLNYLPHEHPERLTRIPGKDIIFAFGNGDVSFYREKFVEQAIDALVNHLYRAKKEKTVLFQSKNPKCLAKYFDKLKPIADVTIVGTTLETNRDEGYSDISKAPLPSVRCRDFLELQWERKIVTIEPVMDFDLEVFTRWIRDISPEAVYLGFNSRPDAVKLPEPSLEKFWQLYNTLSDFTEVKLKETRR